MQPITRNIKIDPLETAEPVGVGELNARLGKYLEILLQLHRYEHSIFGALFDTIKGFESLLGTINKTLDVELKLLEYKSFGKHPDHCPTNTSGSEAGQDSIDKELL